MHQQKVVYRYYKYDGEQLRARREIPYEMKLSSRLLIDELCFEWNKEELMKKLDHAIDHGNEAEFKRLSKQYMDYIWE